MNRIQRDRKDARLLRMAALLSILSTLLLLLLVALRIGSEIIFTSPVDSSADSLAAARAYHLEQYFPDRQPVPDIVVSTPLATPDTIPSLVIVLDDFGNQWNTEIIQSFLSMDVPLTIAVIPNLWASDRVARAAMRAGKEVLVHLPMQPIGENQPLEKRFLHASMDGDMVRSFLDQAASGVRGAVGLNNHMGSAASQDSLLMARVAEWAERRGWIILDSVTHPSTVLYREAHRQGVPSLRRDIFLDHYQDEARIRRQLERAVELARKRQGPVVVIGHPHEATWRVLREDLPAYMAEGIRMLTVSSVVNNRL